MKTICMMSGVCLNGCQSIFTFSINSRVSCQIKLAKTQMDSFQAVLQTSSSDTSTHISSPFETRRSTTREDCLHHSVAWTEERFVSVCFEFLQNQQNEQSIECGVSHLIFSLNPVLMVVVHLKYLPGILPHMGDQSGFYHLVWFPILFGQFEIKGGEFQTIHGQSFLMVWTILTKF